MKLFTEFSLEGLTLPNRLVMSPMTRLRAQADGSPRDLNALYYGQRAGAGLLVTECTMVSPTGIGYAHNPGVYTPEQIAGWRRVVDLVHALGGRIFLQIWHAGRVSHSSLQPDGALPVAPSAVAIRGQVHTASGKADFETPRELATAEVAAVVGDFEQAAANAKEAGFDGVEIHAAYGYLIDSFLQDCTNRRTDRYGGSLANRGRFLFEIVEAAEDAFPGRVGVKLSPSNTANDMGDSDPAGLFSYLCSELSNRKVAYIHLMRPFPDDVAKGAKILDPVEALRPFVSVPLLAGGGYERDSAEALLQSGGADMVAFARHFLANPDLATRFFLGAPLNQPDPATFYGRGGEGAKGYTDYPLLGDI